MRAAILIPAAVMFAMTGGCVYERSHHHHHDEVIVAPAAPVAVEEETTYGPPPPVRVEVVPPRPVYESVWVPGHWVREHRRREWVWIGGHWR